MGDEGTSHPWQAYIGDSSIALTDSTSLRIYGPSVYSSFNSASPYGQNDGVLWQGKGFNAYASAGLRLESYGFELTFKPDVAFSQNLAFDFMTPAYANGNALYGGKAGTYGYYGVAYIDAPQRFGDSAFFDWSWGDSEVRYTWNGVTIGFGTQNIWLGPARLNPILHSNNAAPYPKLDVGLRRTSVYMPHFCWYLGDVEGRLWAGYLSESDYFDTDTSNDHNLYSGLSLAWAPPIFEGLTLFANRNYLSKWNKNSAKTLLKLVVINLEGGGAQDVWDQRASLGFSWLVPQAGMEVYGEAGLNDYGPSLDGYIRYPFHSIVYTSGLEKTIALPFLQNAKGVFLFEWSHLEISQDFQFQWPSTFYAHHEITQGYTNRGQWLGAGNGTGGNSQYLGFKLYTPSSSYTIFAHRTNPDNDYIYAKTVHTTNTQEIQDFKAILSFGFDVLHFFNPNISAKLGLVHSVEHNPLYNALDWHQTTKRKNISVQGSFNYSF